MNDEKASLRRHFSTLRDGLPAETRRAAEASVQAALFELPAWREADLVCGYTAIGSEMDLSPVWRRAVAEGKGYALPVTVTGAREGRMVFRRTSGYTPSALIPARYGLSEPSPTCPALTLGDFAKVRTLVIVPGLAFDDHGYRIGYGGGYYDRFLAALADARVPVTTVGLVFSVCRTPTLPHEAHDRPVDHIIDERSVSCPHGLT